MSLLDKALRAEEQSTYAPTFGEEEFELALAWLDGRIEVTQIAHALGRSHNGGTSYVFIARAIRQAYQAGRLIENPNHVPPALRPPADKQPALTSTVNSDSPDSRRPRKGGK